MPIFLLSEQLEFPPPRLATSDGLLAIGGDLSVERLLLAYSSGIFPWYSEEDPILWWSPDPRLILFPNALHVSRRFERLLRRQPFQITFNRCFEKVIRNCAQVQRVGQRGTWITASMIDAYIQLHQRGYAHSVESWQDGMLAGGLYGVSCGACFFGESMFSRVSNASKTAFVALVRRLQQWRFSLIDCQIVTAHLQQFGAHEVSRRWFLQLLEQGVHNMQMPYAEIFA